MPNLEPNTIRYNCDEAEKAAELGHMKKVWEIIDELSKRKSRPSMQAHTGSTRDIVLACRLLQTAQSRGAIEVNSSIPPSNTGSDLRGISI